MKNWIFLATFQGALPWLSTLLQELWVLQQVIHQHHLRPNEDLVFEDTQVLSTPKWNIQNLLNVCFNIVYL